MRLSQHGTLRDQTPIELARARVREAKSAWASVTVDVAQRKAGAEERIALALAELKSAWCAWDDAVRELGK